MSRVTVIDSAPFRRVTLATEPFPLSAVRLLDGPLRERQDIHAQYLRALSPDRLLAPFHTQAGLPPLAERYGGWESRDISGHSLGHYLSALCHLHAATGETWILPRIDHIVAELAACQAANADGYVLPVNKPAFAALREGRIEATPFSLNGVWVPFYTLHKLLAGLRDAHRLAGSTAALAVARGVADWLADVLAPLNPAQVQEMLRTEHGGMNEVFADLAEDTGDASYLAMASRFFHHETVLAPMFRGEDRLDGLHGNTQIPKVVGLAREYELTGEQTYRVAATSFWDHVVNNRSFATGGHGESEHFFPIDQFAQHLTPNTCETCNTYNLLKLTGRLFAWEPRAGHMDFVERATINHLAANIGQKPGEFGYFLGLGSVGVKVFSTPYDSWWCCVGTGLENPARYGELIYHHAAATLWVNQYFASTLDWPEQGVRLTQETRFPESDTVRLTFTCARPTTFALKLRHPAWCTQPELTLNDVPVMTDSSPSSYFTLTREWCDGDTLELRLPMTLRAEPLPVGASQAKPASGELGVSSNAPTAASAGDTSLDIGHWSLDIGHWTLVIGHWSFRPWRSSTAPCCSPPSSPTNPACSIPPANASPNTSTRAARPMPSRPCSSRPTSPRSSHHSVRPAALRWSFPATVSCVPPT